MEYSSSRKNKNYYEKDIEQFQQQNEELNSTFNKLFHSINPGCPINYSLPQNFLNLLKRILSTNFSVMKNDESAIINSLLDKVSKSSNFNQDIINKFQYLYSKLTKKRTLTKRWGILYILNALSKNNFKDINFVATNELQKNYMNMNSNNMLIEKDFQLNNNSNGKYQGNNVLNSSINYFNNLSPVSNINERFYENQNLINSNNQIDNNPEQTIVINPNKTSLIINEKDIINDLLFVFEGINGKYISYDAAEDAYVLNKLIPWSEEIYNIVNSLCEIGWLYKKIKLYLDYFKESNIQSQFIKSFIYSIQNELNDYFKLISFLRKLNSNPNQNLNNGKRSQNLNLKNILLWTLVPKETLKWIANCCEAIHPLKGTSILSQIYSFVHYGGCNNYLNKILNEVSKPFINFVFNWIKYGELQDSYKEFFVDILNGIKDDDIWNLQYQLIGKNVPNFMKREPTIKIFEVGKCIHFIRNHCKENYNLSNLKKILINLINKYSKLRKRKEEKKFMKEDNQMDLEDNDISQNSFMNIRDNNLIQTKNNNKNNIENTEFDYGFDEDKIVFEIESYESCLDFIEFIFDPLNQEEILNMSFINEIIFNIDAIHKLINKDLVRIILEKFKFLTNLDSLNKYFLLGQGDMMQSLMESLYEGLDRSASSILIHNLQSNLESAIRTSNAQYNDPECLKKLNIKLNRPSTGDIGWDVFCLEYKVDLPLSIIFNNKLLKDYQKLFFFFWKIKRLEYSQNNYMWKNIKSFYDFLKDKEDITKKAINISIHFNQEIIHFITSLHNYFVLEVLETQYKKLIYDLSKVNNLDELISKHKYFIDNVKKQCLLDEESIIINKKINNIFEIIIKFKNSYDYLKTLLVGKTYEKSKDDPYISQNFSKNIKRYIQELTILYKDFQNQIIELIDTIKLLGKSNLNYLSMKIDYNDYYYSLKRDKEEKKNIEAINRINAEEEKKRILQESQNDIDNDNDNNLNISDENNQNYKNYRNNNKGNNKLLENVEEGNENIEDEEMDVDDNNNYRIHNDNTNQNMEERNNFNNTNNDNNKFNFSNNKNTLYNRSNFENSNNIFGKSTKYYSSKNNNNLNNINDNLNNVNNINDNLNNINDKNDNPIVKKGKEENIQIITKRKERRPKELINELNINEQSDLNKFYNFSNNNINNEHEDKKLNKNDLESDDNNNLINYNSNNKSYKTQDKPKTYLYDKNNIQGPGKTYNYKSMTKYRPETNINLENVNDDDIITTQMIPQYGITTRSRGRKDQDDKK